jgi:hypothetical protein
MRDALKATLRQAFHGDETLDSLAARLGIGRDRIKRFWESEKRTRALPPIRPRFADRCVKPASVMVEVEPAVAVIDDSPIADPNPSYVENCDAFLTALQTAHGGESWRPLDGMPAHTLQMEANGFPPSRGRVREFARIRDVIVRVLLFKRGKLLCS